MINTTRLRCSIGWLGLLLPWIVVLLTGGFPSSISATYYTAEAITPFMIILGSAGLLLISYKGYEHIDDIINTVAGIFALLICLFPCKTSLFELVGTFQLPPAISAIIHNISAIGFFGLLSFNSLFLFTKTDGNMTKRKKIRNIIYYVCGVGMVASFALFLLPSFRIQTWLVEAAALFFFAISWLTKANYYSWLFAD